MADEMAMELATLLVRKTVEALADPAKDAVVKLVTKVRDRFRGDREAETALAVAEAEPGSVVRLEELARALERISAADPEFAQDLRSLHVMAYRTAQEGGVVNTFIGPAQKVIQMRDVQGEINF